MTLLMRDQENIEKGIAEGKTEGRAESPERIRNNCECTESIPDSRNSSGSYKE